MPRLPSVATEPEGLVYRADFLSPAEERDVLAIVEGMDFAEVVMHGRAAKRTVRHYGVNYLYEAWRLEPTDALPEALTWLRDRCAAFAEVPADDLAETLVTRYPPGAGIGWHRDASLFGEKVIGVSLLGECTMRFQRRLADVRHTWSLRLAPRSVYLLAAAVRSAWQHTIPATTTLRYSITFRSLREGSGG